MLEKIKNAMDPKVDNELIEVNQQVSDLEDFIAKNENTEDEGIMLKVLTYKNTVARLKREIPNIEERLSFINKHAQDIKWTFEWLIGKDSELADVRGMNKNLDIFSKQLFNGELPSAYSCMPNTTSYNYADKPGVTSIHNKHIADALSDTSQFMDRLEKEISQKTEFLKKAIEEYPKLKKILR